jgi:hypothetical protein
MAVCMSKCIRFGVLGLFCLDAACGSLAVGASPAGTSVATIGGAWSRAADIDKALGHPAVKGVPSSLDVVLDKKPGERWDAETDKEMRAELDAQKHRLSATGRLRQDGGQRAADLLVTWRDGESYLCPVIPNADFTAHRFWLIPGATRQQDLLFVEWSGPSGKTAGVCAFRREAK